MKRLPVEKVASNALCGEHEPSLFCTRLLLLGDAFSFPMKSPSPDCLKEFPVTVLRWDPWTSSTPAESFPPPACSPHKFGLLVARLQRSAWLFVIWLSVLAFRWMPHPWLSDALLESIVLQVTE